MGWVKTSKELPELDALYHTSSMKTLLIIIIASMVSCSNPERTVKILEAQGFSEVQTTGYDFFECGRDDFFSTGFKAKNQNGKDVEGVVCCGLFLKGCTTRF